ncbi:MAG: hypothetical protein HRU38_10815 [Saccharospirillaceae bacterium]|nr:hypothetical protein [Saccharospirillaceae bacterium]
MRVNIKTLIANVIQICNALDNAIRHNQQPEVKHLWLELLDLRATVAELERQQPAQANTQQIDRLINKIRPAYEYWCHQRGLTPYPVFR